MQKLFSLFLLLPLLASCSQLTGGRSLSSGMPRHYVGGGEPFRSHGLTIYGYNYTDYGIYSFQVNGRGGGNLLPSSPYSTGGSSVCCFSLYTPMRANKTVKVKWSRGKPEDIWCELEVPLRGPLPDKPEYLEVHFYQDGHVEVAVTEEMSPPRLKLERYSNGQRHATGNVINDDKFARCQRGYF